MHPFESYCFMSRLNVKIVQTGPPSKTFPKQRHRWRDKKPGTVVTKHWYNNVSMFAEEGKNYYLLPTADHLLFRGLSSAELWV